MEAIFLSKQFIFKFFPEDGIKKLGRNSLDLKISLKMEAKYLVESSSTGVCQQMAWAFTFRNL